jgi:hypothetical protein
MTKPKTKKKSKEKIPAIVMCIYFDGKATRPTYKFTAVNCFVRALIISVDNLIKSHSRGGFRLINIGEKFQSRNGKISAVFEVKKA